MAAAPRASSRRSASDPLTGTALEGFELFRGRTTDAETSTAGLEGTTRLQPTCEQFRNAQSKALQEHMTAMGRVGDDYDEVRKLSDGEVELLNMYFTKSVCFIRANEKRSHQLKLREAALSLLLASLNIMCSLFPQFGLVPYWVTVTVAILASLTNSIVNYVQLPRRLGQFDLAKTQWMVVRKYVMDMFKTIEVRNPRDQSYIVEMACAHAEAVNPLLPHWLSKWSVGIEVRRLERGQINLPPAAKIGRLRRDVLEDEQIERLMSQVQRLLKARRICTDKARKWVRLDFFLGIMISIATVLSTGASIALGLREDLSWIRNFVSACSGCASVASALQSHIRPGIQSQHYFQYSLQARRLVRTAEDLLHFGPHTNVQDRLMRFSEDEDHLHNSMRMGGLDYFDHDLPHSYDLEGEAPSSIESFSSVVARHGTNGTPTR